MIYKTRQLKVTAYQYGVETLPPAVDGSELIRLNGSVRQCKTLNGWIDFQSGDFLVVSDSEIYPVKPEIFNRKYKALV